MPTGTKKSDKLEAGNGDQEFAGASPSKEASADCPDEQEKETPNSCYLHKLKITSKWPSAAKAPVEDEPVDQNQLDMDVRKKQQELVKIQAEYDATIGTGLWDRSKASDLNQKREVAQDELLVLLKQRTLATKLEAWEPPTGERVFEIYKQVPEEFQDAWEKARAKSEDARTRFQELEKEWDDLHKEHEDSKENLLKYGGELKSLATKRDRARLDLEAARRRELERKEDLDKHNAKYPAGKTGFFHDLKKKAGKDKEGLHQKAVEDSQKKEAKFKAARNAWADKAGSEGMRLRRIEVEKKQALRAKGEEMNVAVQEIESIEGPAVLARNSLASGATPIKILSGGHEDWWKDWPDYEEGKSDDAKYGTMPTIQVEVDSDMKPEGHGASQKSAYCGEDPPPANNVCKGKHPHILVQDQGWFSTATIQEAVGGEAAEFKVSQAQQFPQYDKLADLKEVLRIQRFYALLKSSFSSKRKPRTVQVRATTCGKPDPEALEGDEALVQDIEIWPSDSFAFQLTTDPAWSSSAESESNTVTQEKPKDEAPKNGTPADLTLKDIPLVNANQNTPIQIEFKRNDTKDKTTDDIQDALGTVLLLSQKTANAIGRVSNIIPSFGWKVTFAADFVTGTFDYEHRYKEHWDNEIWLYRRAAVSVNLVTVKIGLFAGVWMEVGLLEFKVGAEISIKGSIGFEGYYKTLHPDSDAAANGKEIALGPVGSVGCGAELMVVVGSADWCKGSGTIESAMGFAGRGYISHEDGPHIEGAFKFEGIKAGVTFKLKLVGEWETSHTFAKERTLTKTRKWPSASDPKEIHEASEERTDIGQRSLADAVKTEKRVAEVEAQARKDREAALADNS